MSDGPTARIWLTADQVADRIDRAESLGAQHIDSTRDGKKVAVRFSLPTTTQNAPAQG